MDKKSIRRWLIAGGLGLVLILVVVGIWWWLLREDSEAAITDPPLVIHAFLIEPVSGEEVRVGDYVPVVLQVDGPSDFLNAELFVNGESIGIISEDVDLASWVWQPDSNGIKHLTAKIKDIENNIGSTQNVIVNVLAGPEEIEYAALEGQSLQEIGLIFGVSIDQLESSNSKIGVDDPLQEGYPVVIPIKKAPQSTKSEQGSNPEDLPLITWQFSTTEPVDRTYCYLSAGEGEWFKMPGNPFEFFNGASAEYIQTGFFPQGEGLIQVECWGWDGATLKSLGQGNTEFDPSYSSGLLEISAPGFILKGYPEFPEAIGGGDIKQIPAPFALRKTVDVNECVNNFGNPLAWVVCDPIINAKVKQYFILLWEWEEGPCPFNQEDCPWNNDIAGYRIYEADKNKQNLKFLKEVNQIGQKATVIPIPWGGGCFGVQAFPKDPAHESSEVVVMCDGEIPPVPESIVVDPSNWLTTQHTWTEDGDCDTYGTGNFSYTGLPLRVLVRSIVVDDEDNDCFRKGNSAVGIKFDLNNLYFPPGAVVQKVTLKYSHYAHSYSAQGLATNYEPSCVSALGTSKQDWTGLSSNHIYNGENKLKSVAYFLPFKSMGGFDYTPEIDVTPIVRGWLKNPTKNNGFILTPIAPPYPLDDGSGGCYSYLENFLLHVQYFVPEN